MGIKFRAHFRAVKEKYSHEQFIRLDEIPIYVIHFPKAQQNNFGETVKWEK